MIADYPPAPSPEERLLAALESIAADIRVIRERIEQLDEEHD